MGLRVVGEGPDEPQDDLDEALVQAQADIATAAKGMRRDPYGVALAALSGVVGVFRLSVRRWERAVGDVIEARKPIPSDEWATLKDELRADITSMLQRGVEDGAYKAMRTEAARMVRTVDTRQMVLAGLACGMSAVLGAVLLGGALYAFRVGPFDGSAEIRRAWQEVEMANPDPRAALGKAFTGSDGRRMALFWVDQAQPPARP